MPYPPPWKSILAKTNHLPNISWGLAAVSLDKACWNRDSQFISITKCLALQRYFRHFDATKFIVENNKFSNGLAQTWHD
ncbi:hypothetical protein OCA5_c03800 [Afipia carboxidovorans OM5]|uniref:Uncharacterized protein n=1 Tax=Afipia carboxidovorans (strain ATCC 49405 / DSM 1227 / KCTC 32145 / OM5) TaxID=504832 RepID=F8BUQ2_AFIC5|nr:hypothetical protein OCA4_c03790 [Afipia carboxidovorans OM4]AEI05105.1 hypothetical protein OCA5_c03800 [Afipia carboxidovorans OM5]